MFATLLAHSQLLSNTLLRKPSTKQHELKHTFYRAGSVLQQNTKSYLTEYIYKNILSDLSKSVGNRD